jgi:hypothetical protein
MVPEEAVASFSMWNTMLEQFTNSYKGNTCNTTRTHLGRVVYATRGQLSYLRPSHAGCTLEPDCSQMLAVLTAAETLFNSSTIGQDLSIS